MREPSPATPRGARQGLAAARPAAYPAAVLAAVLALSLAALSADDEEVAAPGGRGGLEIAAVGGTAIEVGTAHGRSFAIAGAEVSWAFDSIDVGILAQAYRFGDAGASPWEPVVLARIEQRFETARGLDAYLAFGIGAGKVTSWLAWYQVALGVRLAQGPLAVGGEIGFEQYQLLRLVASIGGRF